MTDTAKPNRKDKRRHAAELRRQAERERNSATRGGANRKPRKERAGAADDGRPPLDEVLAGGPWEGDGDEAELAEGGGES